MHQRGAKARGDGHLTDLDVELTPAARHCDDAVELGQVGFSVWDGGQQRDGGFQSAYRDRRTVGEEVVWAGGWLAGLRGLMQQRESSVG